MKTFTEQIIEAREAIGMSKTPHAARGAVAYQKESIAKYEGRI